MCGILGWIGSAPEGIAERMRSTARLLWHRGPDSGGFFSAKSGNVELGHRRLAIIDPGDRARQPMELEDAGLALTFNGEIYNHRELRAELELRGCRFRTQSDTETLLHAWSEWGPACLRRLVGMFAFAIHDAHRKRVFLVRDCFGIKPLYYSRPGGSVAFASEVPALLELAAPVRRVNPRRVFDFLQWGVADHGGETFFEGIHQLPPAHYWELCADGAEVSRPVRYWDLPDGGVTGLSLEDASGRLRELFLESVALHLRSDVPVGVALSGGVDSSSVLMAARRVLGASAAIRTFSFIADDPAISEDRWVEAASTAANAESHKFGIRAGDLAEDFDKFVACQGEPLTGPIGYAQWRVFREAAGTGIKVLLEGQGADECFAGYPVYAQARLAGMLHCGRFARAAGFARANACSWRVAASTFLPEALLRRVHAARGAERTFPWIRPAWIGDSGIDTYRPVPRGRRALRQSLRDTMFRSKLPAFLRWGDRNAMAWSIENRVPFLTPRLAEFVHSLPDEYLIGADGTTKMVFRMAMRGIVPDKVLARKAKLGFATPFQAWLEPMRPQVAELLEIAAGIPALDAGRMLRDVAPFLSGQPIPARIAQRLWSVLFLAGWTRRFGVSHS